MNLAIRFYIVTSVPNIACWGHTHVCEVGADSSCNLICVDREMKGISIKWKQWQICIYTTFVFIVFMHSVTNKSVLFCLICPYLGQYRSNFGDVELKSHYLNRLRYRAVIHILTHSGSVTSRELGTSLTPQSTMYVSNINMFNRTTLYTVPDHPSCYM